MSSAVYAFSGLSSWLDRSGHQVNPEDADFLVDSFPDPCVLLPRWFFPAFLRKDQTNSPGQFQTVMRFTNGQSIAGM